MNPKPAGKPAVTIYKIAEYVGVSPAAVSSVLANRHVERRLAAETVRKIREAAHTLGYVPNMAGRRLRASQPAIRQIDLAILTSYEAPLPIVGQVLHALQQAADAQTNKHTRFAISIEMFHAGKLKEKPDLLDGNRYHGVILTNTLPADDQFLSTAKLPYSVVVLGRRLPGYCCVLEIPDYVGRRAAEVLIEAGSQQLAVLYGKRLTQATEDRVAAFQRAAKARLGREAISLVSDGLTAAGAAAALNDFFSAGGTCDGLFTVTDSLAVGAYHSIHRAGRRVPHDIAVVGVGDYEFCEYFIPPLSTIAGANDAMVAEAVPLLFRLMRGEKDVPFEVLVVPPVYLRSSTQRVGCPPPRPAKRVK